MVLQPSNVGRYPEFFSRITMGLEHLRMTVDFGETKTVTAQFSCFPIAAARKNEVECELVPGVGIARSSLCN